MGRTLWTMPERDDIRRAVWDARAAWPNPHYCPGPVGELIDYAVTTLAGEAWQVPFLSPVPAEEYDAQQSAMRSAIRSAVVPVAEELMAADPSTAAQDEAGLLGHLAWSRMGVLTWEGARIVLERDPDYPTMLAAEAVWYSIAAAIADDD